MATVLVHDLRFTVRTADPAALALAAAVRLGVSLVSRRTRSPEDG